jgi:hypothetical protein
LVRIRRHHCLPVSQCPVSHGSSSQLSSMANLCLFNPNLQQKTQSNENSTSMDCISTVARQNYAEMINPEVNVPVIMSLGGRAIPYTCSLEDCSLDSDGELQQDAGKLGPRFSSQTSARAHRSDRIQVILQPSAVIFHTSKIPHRVATLSWYP